MAYCTRNNMIDRFGEQELIQLTDRDNLNAIDDSVLTPAITDASAEIDSYLSKYTLPLQSVPTTLIRISCDITRYNLYDDAVDESSPWVIKYRNAQRFLKMVSQGFVSIGVDNLGSKPETNDFAEMQSGGRVFGRNDDSFI